MRGGAWLDESGRYRYLLWRHWDPRRPRAAFVLLNPSVADADADDPTLRRCLGFARRLGAGSLEIVNLYAWRATSPRELALAADPVGGGNDAFIARAAGRCAWLIAGWGMHGAGTAREAEVAALARGRWSCLGVTRAGAPRHPLYLKASAPLRPWPL